MSITFCSVHPPTLRTWCRHRPPRPNGATVVAGAVGVLSQRCPCGETAAGGRQPADRTPRHARTRVNDQRRRVAVIVLRVPRMTSRRHVRAVTSALRDLPGVETLQADSSSASLVVEGTVSEQDVRITLADIGFAADGRTQVSWPEPSSP